MAARYRSGYLVSRRRGALSHANALATGERLHLESVHIPKLIFCPFPYTSLSFFIVIGVRRADYIFAPFSGR
jgi:hypothetical protein